MSYPNIGDDCDFGPNARYAVHYETNDQDAAIQTMATALIAFCEVPQAGREMALATVLALANTWRGQAHVSDMGHLAPE